jgi:Protein of unknown function (DUF3365)
MKCVTICGVVGLSVAAFTAAGLAVSGESSQASGQPSAAALERSRNTVRMLDDIYKTAIVLVTDRYVEDESSYPAGAVAVQWFEAISKKGWHDVRLIDATGAPYDDANVARDDFEKEGLRQLGVGQPYYEQVVQKDGKPHLRAVTAVPVVLEKCVLCHPHYADAKKGAAIGAISYTVPIE